MRQKLNRKNRGFTLTEMLIASSIFCVTMVTLITLYIFYWRTLDTDSAVLDVSSNSKIAIGWIEEDVRWGAYIVPQYPLTGSAIYTTGDNPSCVVFQVPSIIIDPNDPLHKNIVTVPPQAAPTQFDTIIYYLPLNSTVLYRIVQPYTAGTMPSIRVAENRQVATIVRLPSTPLFYCMKDCMSPNPVFYPNNTSNSESLGTFIAQNGANSLSNINDLLVSMPLSYTMLSISGAGTQVISADPITMIKLRNK